MPKFVGYHGTTGSFKTLKPAYSNGLGRPIKGIFFSTDRGFAEIYAVEGRLIKAEITINKPATRKDIKRLDEDDGELHQQLKKLGFDGVVDPGAEVIVALEPSQVRVLEEIKMSAPPDLPANHKKLTIQQTVLAMRRLGYELIRGMSNVTGPTRYLWRKGGEEVVLDTNQIKRMMGYDVRASITMSKMPSDSDLRKLSDAYAKIRKMTNAQVFEALGEKNSRGPMSADLAKAKLAKKISGVDRTTFPEKFVYDDPRYLQVLKGEFRASLGASCAELGERHSQPQMTTVATIRS